MSIQTTKQRYGIIGNCREINTAVEIALQVAPTEVTVLIYGENGTGKDVFSRVIHDHSKRRHKKMLAINTGAIPAGTLDSELFGHERGSFTTAYENRKGYFEEVEGGSIFLDEIGEMPTETQARLLRLLENGDFLRVGSNKVMKADVRVIAATNKNLVDLIRQGKFREDLFFRLNTVSITIPPLRDRGDDIELLFSYFALVFAEKYNRDPLVLDQDAIPLMYQYRWPGNVRELRNLVEKLTVLVKGDIVSPTILKNNLLIQDSYLPSVLPNQPGPESTNSNAYAEGREGMLLNMIYELGKEMADLKKMVYQLGMQQGNMPENGRPTGYPIPNQGGGYAVEPLETPVYQAPIQPIREPSQLLEESLSLEKKEKELITKALNKHGNNRKKAASELGISERTLYRKIKNYDIDL
ncbi:sigma 54-interacting transcriptional regulator [Pontibacter sp. G13]|uniref:sigma-54 interaction domain-containing protein n=1 Tax=Pontibacter sp. G13 TaxID=3074898 RepID=UPI00288BC1E6|nr:sigma 54-interacting transcriptional regulator [Pontibacter sp. G13]WNJ18087.1 sigma 54-interacting transcriptional regulator [Pontibacter sp. G13]